MPITFEEVTADIDRAPQRGEERREPAAPKPQELQAQIEQALRLQAEREQRLSDR